MEIALAIAVFTCLILIIQNSIVVSRNYEYKRVLSKIGGDRFFERIAPHEYAIYYGLLYKKKSRDFDSASLLISILFWELYHKKANKTGSYQVPENINSVKEYIDWAKETKKIHQTYGDHTPFISISDLSKTHDKFKTTYATAKSDIWPELQ